MPPMSPRDSGTGQAAAEAQAGQKFPMLRLQSACVVQGDPAAAAGFQYATMCCAPRETRAFSYAHFS
ncbi:hypothetical protein PUN4_1000005 [Paraburkholderia unamae]|nr:hypothetical protein PUN4_1000005 [Paraburkholderia unamae]